ncbi:hypothetical protein ACXR2T_07740 [Leucobacter sp. HY1910]
MSSWNTDNGYGNFGESEETGRSDTFEPVAPASDPEEQHEDTAAADEAATDAPAHPATDKAPKKRRARPTTVTKAQVLSVLETHTAIGEASSEARTVLRSVVRCDADAPDDELTALAITQDRADNPLSVIGELREALATSPFTVPAIIAGMDKAKRVRPFAVLAAVTGSDESLPSADVAAAVSFANLLSALSDEQVAALDEAQALLGR